MSQMLNVSVTPAKAGVHLIENARYRGFPKMDARLRGHDAEFPESGVLANKDLLT